MHFLHLKIIKCKALIKAECGDFPIFSQHLMLPDGTSMDIHGHPTLESEIFHDVRCSLNWDWLNHWGFQIPGRFRSVDSVSAVSAVSGFRCQVPIGPLAQHTRFDGGDASWFGFTDFTDVILIQHLVSNTKIKTYQNILVTISKRLQTYQNIFSNTKFTMFLVYSKVYWVAMNLLRPCLMLTFLRQEWFDVSSKAGKLGQIHEKNGGWSTIFHGKNHDFSWENPLFLWRIMEVFLAHFFGTSNYGWFSGGEFFQWLLRYKTYKTPFIFYGNINIEVLIGIGINRYWWI